jgi:hypothetical protein
MILLINFGYFGGQRANLGEIARRFRLKAEEQPNIRLKLPKPDAKVNILYRKITDSFS